jgi:hypothetical protein
MEREAFLGLIQEMLQDLREVRVTKLVDSLNSKLVDFSYSQSSSSTIECDT